MNLSTYNMVAAKNAYKEQQWKKALYHYNSCNSKDKKHLENWGHFSGITYLTKGGKNALILLSASLNNYKTSKKTEDEMMTHIVGYLAGIINFLSSEEYAFHVTFTKKLKNFILSKYD